MRPGSVEGELGREMSRRRRPGSVEAEAAGICPDEGGRLSRSGGGRAQSRQRRGGDGEAEAAETLGRGVGLGLEKQAC
jgi:hypothetical protein